MPWNGSCVAFQLGVVFLLNTSIKRSGTHYRSTELLINCSPSTVLRDHYHSHMYSFVIAEKKKKWGINSLFRSIEGERLKTKRRRIALAEAKSNFCHTTSNEMEDTAPETLLVHINCLLRLLVIGTNCIKWYISSLFPHIWQPHGGNPDARSSFMLSPLSTLTS